MYAFSTLLSCIMFFLQRAVVIIFAILSSFNENRGRAQKVVLLTVVLWEKEKRKFCFDEDRNDCLFSVQHCRKTLQ